MCDLFGWSHILIYSETMFPRLLPGVAFVVMSYQCQLTCVHICAYLSICYDIPASAISDLQAPSPRTVCMRARCL